ncbi:hypothetical protein [Pseudonocardia zijingensis]|uniref:Helix-turn-helix DNA binding domain protein n=1 Tax=Pseudonocardia zijingensis TaxID=153376 RepID=A0ABN1N8X1_9PSEU
MHRQHVDFATEAGYRRHIAEGTVPCGACCDAHAVEMANWRAHRRTRTQPRLRSFADHPIQYRAAWDGDEPAEALTPDDRRRLVMDLHDLGWDDERIARHTRQTTYTTARIRGQLGLLPNPRPGQQEGVA